jgi:hypothetical protein
MKKINLLALVLMLNLTSFGQSDSILVSMTGTNQVIVKSKENSSVIYNRTLNWVNKTYKNPDKVIVGKQENRYVTVSGFDQNVMSFVSLGMNYSYDMSYHIYMTVLDTGVNFYLAIDKISLSTTPGKNSLYCSSFYKKDGTPRENYADLKKQLERSLNNLLNSYRTELNNSTLTSDEALAELKRAKDKLDLGLITQEEYDKLKSELAKFIR